MEPDEVKHMCLACKFRGCDRLGIRLAALMRGSPKSPAKMPWIQPYIA